jgi:hypothetical protein
MKKVSIENVIFLILSICLAVYSFIRATQLSITHDEVGNYLGYSIYPVMDIIKFTNLQLGNHVLNSLLVKLTTSLFGLNEFALRLPNLIAHLFYLYFSWKILRLLTKDKYLAIAGFILVNFNPYLLDFFSLSRGYGLEISTMIVGLYFMIMFWKNGKPKYLWGAVIMNALGVLSNLTFIPVYFSMILMINFLKIVELIQLKNSFKSSILTLLKLNIPVLVISVCLAALVVGPIIRLESIGEFSARANNDGFWDNLFRSVIRHSLYMQFDWESLQYSLTSVVQVLSALLIILFAYHIYNAKWNATRSGFFIMISMLMIICLWFYFQHLLLGSRYPHQRTALFIFPLFMLTLVAAFDLITSFRLALIPARTILIIASFFVLFHFYKAANSSFCFDWYFDASTKKMLTENFDTMKSVAPDNERRVKFGTYWMYRPGIEFYLKVNNIDWIELITYRDSFKEQADFYYIPYTFKDSIAKFNPVVLKDYKLSFSKLYSDPSE